jgi:peptide deformylase
MKWKAGSNPLKSRWGCYLPVLTRLASKTPAPTFRGGIWWVLARKASVERVDRLTLLHYLNHMSIKPIITLPDDKFLRQTSAPLKTVDDAARRLFDDMLETMYDAPGIGLAAIQIGVPQRAVVIDLSKEGEERKPMFFANPEIVWSSEAKGDYEEGCLSIPDFYEMVERPKDIKLRYLDRLGEPHEMTASGLLATCLQHEIDHLNGILFIDYISKLKRDRVIKKFQKAQKLGKL